MGITAHLPQLGLRKCLTREIQHLMVVVIAWLPRLWWQRCKPWAWSRPGKIQEAKHNLGLAEVSPKPRVITFLPVMNSSLRSRMTPVSQKKPETPDCAWW